MVGGGVCYISAFPKVLLVKNDQNAVAESTLVVLVFPGRAAYCDYLDQEDYEI